MNVLIILLTDMILLDITFIYVFIILRNIYKQQNKE